MGRAEPSLQPLRVPSQWTVVFNDFRQTMAPAYLCEDLFQARCPRANVLVDLGWYPDSDPAGCFRVVAHRGDFHGEELMREEATTLDDAVAMLEGALRRFVELS